MRLSKTHIQMARQGDDMTEVMATNGATVAQREGAEPQRRVLVVDDEPQIV